MIRNSILWDNTAAVPATSEIHNIATVGTTDISYSDVQGGWTGMGNLDADPVFVDPTAPMTTDGQGDYRLRVGSPCRDAGDNGSLPSDTADLSLNGDTQETLPNDLADSPRIDGSSVDMGAYEWHSSGG